jgi:L-alanine-DL-glutamate epimerase-like enolase superfamily enzyme
MLITNIQITPLELKLRTPHRTVYRASTDSVQVVFVRVETRRQAETVWGCAAFDPALTGETLETVTQACQACADRARDLNPLNTEHALAEIASLTEGVPAARCAFDMIFHDLLGLAADLPLYRLLGGYRNRIQTSVTVSLAGVPETVEEASSRASLGFRMLKIKGGLDPEEDVCRVQAVHSALPGLTLRLDADQGYSVQQALDVARALEGKLEMLEQPTPAGDLDALGEVTRHSPVPILASQSLREPPSALEIAGRRAAHGLNVKLATCGGLSCARQVEAIARAAQLSIMVGCLSEPALLIAAGLGLALSSPAVRYADLDGHFDLVDDPTRAGFRFEDGWLIAGEEPGLGCAVDL